MAGSIEVEVWIGTQALNDQLNEGDVVGESARDLSSGLEPLG